MKDHKVLTEKQKEDIINEVIDGTSYCKLAKKYGVHRPRIRNIALKAGVSSQHKPFNHSNNKVKLYVGIAVLILLILAFIALAITWNG